MISYFKVSIKSISQIKNQKYNSQTGTDSAILSALNITGFLGETQKQWPDEEG